jgi:hypothetical protein
MSKHRKPSWHRTPALWVGGFLLLGAIGALLVGIAVSSSADPLDRPAVVPGGLAPADFAERVSAAHVTSRDQDRLDRYKEQLRQERIEKRREARQAERREARQAERAAAREEAAEQAAQEESTSVVASSGDGTNSGSDKSGTLPDLLLFIRSHESGGNYGAYNASGCEGYGCGGAYQLHAAYAAEWAARAGYPGLSGQAQTWPAATQDAVALHLFYSTNPDGAHWCNWTDYC